MQGESRNLFIKFYQYYYYYLFSGHNSILAFNSSFYAKCLLHNGECVLLVPRIVSHEKCRSTHFHSVTNAFVVGFYFFLCLHIPLTLVVIWCTEYVTLMRCRFVSIEPTHHSHTIRSHTSAVWKYVTFKMKAHYKNGVVLEIKTELLSVCLFCT